MAREEALPRDGDAAGLTKGEETLGEPEQRTNCYVSECMFSRRFRESVEGGKYKLTNTSIDLNVLFSLSWPSLFPRLLFSVCMASFSLPIWRAAGGLYFLSIFKYCGDGQKTE